MSANLSMGGFNITNGSFVGNGSGLTNLPVTSSQQSPITQNVNYAWFSATNIGTAKGSNAVFDNITLGTTSLSTNLMAITNDPQNGWILSATVGTGFTNGCWKAP